MEGGISYDENGNLQRLHRKSSMIGGSGGSNVDALGYTYDSTYPNRLNQVKDTTGNNLGFNNATGSTGNYTYDNPTGNLTNDPYKGLNLKYNSLNRVDSIVTTVSGMHKAYITYTYDAAGNVLRKQVFSDSTHLQSTNDYIDGFVYTDSTLSYTAMPEGRIINSGGTLVPEYVISDQQGNARFSFQVNGAAIKIVQENSYYAFGERLANSPVATPTLPNINLYNGGSEWQNEFSNLPDYDQSFYRNYDPAIGRFIGTDPLAQSVNGYGYAENNPVMMNDPTGGLAGGGSHGNLYGKNAVPGVGHNGLNEFDVQAILDKGEGNYSQYDLAGMYYMGGGGGPTGGGGGDGSGGGDDSGGSSGDISGDGGDYSAFWTPALEFLYSTFDALPNGHFADISNRTLGQGAILQNAVNLGFLTEDANGNFDETDNFMGFRLGNEIADNLAMGNAIFGRANTGIAGPMDCVFQSIAFATGRDVMDIQGEYADFVNKKQIAEGMSETFNTTKEEVGYEGVKYGYIGEFLGNYGYYPGYSSIGAYNHSTLGDVGILLLDFGGGGHAVDITGMADPTHYNYYDPQNDLTGTMSKDDSSIYGAYGQH